MGVCGRPRGVVWTLWRGPSPSVPRACPPRRAGRTGGGDFFHSPREAARATRVVEWTDGRKRPVLLRTLPGTGCCGGRRVGLGSCSCDSVRICRAIGDRAQRPGRLDANASGVRLANCCHCLFWHCCRFGGYSCRMRRGGGGWSAHKKGCLSPCRSRVRCTVHRPLDGTPQLVTSRGFSGGLATGARVEAMCKCDCARHVSETCGVSRDAVRCSWKDL